MSDGLSLLSDYNSDEEIQPEEKPRLPLPDVLKSGGAEEEVVDDPDEHQGRSRRYPHKRGNWNSLVYIPYEKSPAFDVLCDQMIDLCSDLVQLNKVSEPHVSLTRTFVLLYHFIDGFVSSLKTSLKAFSRFDLQFDGLKIYCNEDLSRTFLGLTVGFGKTEIASTVQLLDKTLSEFSLHPFYDEASFHMSILWALGDARSALTKLLPQLEVLVEASLSDSLDLTIPINYYVCKIGHKLYCLNLT